MAQHRLQRKRLQGFVVLAEQKTSTRRSGKLSRPLRCNSASSGQVHVSGIVADVVFATHACCNLIQLEHRSVRHVQPPCRPKRPGPQPRRHVDLQRRRGGEGSCASCASLHTDMLEHECSCSRIKTVKRTLKYSCRFFRARGS